MDRMDGMDRVEKMRGWTRRRTDGWRKPGEQIAEGKIRRECEIAMGMSDGSLFRTSLAVRGTSYK
jgi:hypothetical protein